VFLPLLNTRDAVVTKISVPKPEKFVPEAGGQDSTIAYLPEYSDFGQARGRQRHWNIGGSQGERRRRENRGAVGGEEVGSGEGLCPFPENKLIFRLKIV